MPTEFVEAFVGDGSRELFEFLTVMALGLVAVVSWTCWYLRQD